SWPVHSCPLYYLFHLLFACLLFSLFFFSLFFFTAPATPEIYTLSLHDALPISAKTESAIGPRPTENMWWLHTPHPMKPIRIPERSEEHTSELQSRFDLVCRLLLEKKKKNKKNKQKQK